MTPFATTVESQERSKEKKRQKERKIKKEKKKAIACEAV